ncbi:hypothetical protein [Paenibacillus pseudetheri]|uniref:Collagen-like protein n=1 Tax=Paenibacillus pseudetheri TaxID=2897682 RepID=A0ABM9BGF5_9BACL|nr:hypothetical protein [Paenibacillus pseudetheri]CAH1058146.1 hypothetical protein PAECIP111894_04319 [Paenibacillus pseudetheri]
MGPQGVAGPVGPQGEQGVPDTQGFVGPQGPQGLPGSAGAIGPQGFVGATESPGAAGAAGATGATGAAGSVLGFADFFALMPPDNAATVAPGTDVSFPQNGPTSGTTISRTGPSFFNLAAIGTYQVLFQVSVTEAGQLILTRRTFDKCVLFYPECDIILLMIQ